MKSIILALISFLGPQTNPARPLPPKILCAILDYPPPVSSCGGNGTVIISPGGILTYSFMMSQVPCFTGCSSVIGFIRP